jgi:hypothetical protein
LGGFSMDRIKRGREGYQSQGKVGLGGWYLEIFFVARLYDLVGVVFYKPLDK